MRRDGSDGSTERCLPSGSSSSALAVDRPRTHPSLKTTGLDHPLRGTLYLWQAEIWSVVRSVRGVLPSESDTPPDAPFLPGDRHGRI